MKKCTLQMSKSFDVAIIGSGAAASVFTAALRHLANNSCSRASVSSSSASSSRALRVARVCGSGKKSSTNIPPRFYNVNYGTLLYMNEIGINIPDEKICPIDSIVVNDYRSESFVNFQSCSKSGDRNDGHRICYMIAESDIIKACERSLTTGSCNKQLLRLETIESDATDLVGDSRRIIKALTTTSGDTIEADLFVAADGSESKMAAKVFDRHGSYPFEFDFDQTAIIATLKHLRPRDESFYWQKFLPEGPLAILPIKDCSESSLVWCVQKSTANHLLSLNRAQFISALNKSIIEVKPISDTISTGLSIFDKIMKNCCPSYDSHSNAEINPDTGFKLPNVVTDCKPDTLAKFDLKFKVRRCFVNSNFALIGDAVHRIHPLSGQGFNLAVKSVKNLSEQLKEAFDLGFPLSENLFLERYETNHRRSCWMKIMSTPLMYFAFKPQDSLCSSIRSFGMTLFNNFPPIKDQAIRLNDDM
ncbi:MAG: putative ubiquinone biosynthesis monooxygenase [Marteilia pararefringens]